jgi:hypothetical protein
MAVGRIAVSLPSDLHTSRPTVERNPAGAEMSGDLLNCLLKMLDLGWDCRSSSSSQKYGALLVSPFRF